MIALASIVLMASAGLIAPPALIAASARQEVDEVYQIPAEEWRYVELGPLGLDQRAAMVWASFEVEAGSKQVRLALMRREDLDRLREGLPHGMIDETDATAAGRLPPHVRGPGDYVVVVANRGDLPAAVHLRIGLDFSGDRGPEVSRLSPRRQLTVILISFAVFFGIVSWSAHRLLRGMKR